MITYLPIPKLIAIKTLSVVFDAVLGLFAYLIISLKYKRSSAAMIGALVVVCAPTIFINSAAWGQCDAIYTAFCLGSLFFLLKQQPARACVFFALALSFKLQAIFFLPVLLMLLLKRKLPLKYLTLIPLIFLLMLVPALIAGRDAPSLLTIYAGQVTSNSGAPGSFNGGAPGPLGGRGTGPFDGGAPRPFGGRGTGPFNGGAPGPLDGRGTGPFNGRLPGPLDGGRFGGSSVSLSSLTANAPSFYQWLPANAPAYWKWVGILLAVAVVVLVGVLLVASKKQPHQPSFSRSH